MMVEKKEKQKKGTISEEDTSFQLERYSVRTILTLLQEVAQVADARIDWNTLAKNTASGISSAREYQMLWRHLAYRHSLVEKMDDVAGPLDDDSDLDFEIEPFPSVNNESLTEAAACVKVLIASGIQSESDVPNSSAVEAPLTIGISNSQSSRANLENPEAACLMQGMHVTVPISIQRQPLPTPSSTEVFDVNGAAGSNSASRRKRKAWSKAEDMELIAAVQKCGEGNWANILKGDFKGDRTASQLSQRWSIIRKRHRHLNVGSSATSTQLSGAQIDAAHRAVSFALDLPVNNSKAAPVQTQNEPSQSSMPTRPMLVEPLPSAAKSGINASKNSFMKSTYSSDSIVRATAVAAGARIVSPSDAASLLKAAKTKNAIHIKSNGVSMNHLCLAMHLYVRMHILMYIILISTINSATSGPSYVSTTPTGACENLVKVVSPKVQGNGSTSAILMNLPSDHISSATGPPMKQEVKGTEECKIPESCLIPKEEVQDDETHILGDRKCKKAREGNLASQNSEAGVRSLSTCIENPIGSPDMEIDDNTFKASPAIQVQMENKVNDDEMMDSPNKQGSQNESVADNRGNHCTNDEQESCRNRSTNAEQPNSTIMVVGEGIQNPAG